MELTASDRSALVRLAARLPKGSEERRAILSSLKRAGIRVNTERWQGSSGKSVPNGNGSWMFTFDLRSRDYNDKNVWFTHNGPYAEAKKQAIEWAKQVNPKAFEIFLAP